MRIVAGEYKYRNLEVPRGIRPTTEKVREAVFSMIREWIPGAVVLDLFAGSGAMGLEALSRGADLCWFCESSRVNARILTDNIRMCRAEDKARVLNCDFRAALERIDGKVDVVIMDPPYEMTEYYDDAMRILVENGLVDEGSVIIAEHLYDNKLSETYGPMRRTREKKYGSIGVDVYICE